MTAAYEVSYYASFEGRKQLMWCLETNVGKALPCSVNLHNYNLSTIHLLFLCFKVQANSVHTLLFIF